jgi:hypothetical protein
LHTVFVEIREHPTGFGFCSSREEAENAINDDSWKTCSNPSTKTIRAVHWQVDANAGFVTNILFDS